jgi:hypothetical protein
MISFQLREILNEMAPSNGADDSIYSTLMRKKKKKNLSQKEQEKKEE